MTKPGVIISKQTCSKGAFGVLQLDSESTLNSLTLEMVEALYETLVKWQSDPDIAFVFLHAIGEKAFCAGGDVQQLYHSARSTPGGPCEYAETFFAFEYRLNYLMHTYGKPIVCWGNGIVMGGGLGLLAGASHRIGTKDTRIAMPEITIALFPDVGGSWILNRLAHKLGYFLALTGAPLNLVDALECGELDYGVVNTDKPAFINTLTLAEWSGIKESNKELLDNILQEHSTPRKTLESEETVVSQTAEFRDRIADIFASDDLTAVLQGIEALEGDSRWIQTAKRTLLAGSPLSTILIFEQLKRSREYSLEEVFQSELSLATNIVRYPEFAEGVRALLIDKDKQPNWAFPSISDVPNSLIEDFFKPPWKENPLADLGN